MRLPRLRLKWPALPFERLAELELGATFWYALYAGVLFVVFLVANFPHDLMVKGILRSLTLGSWRIEVDGTRFAWWRGFELRGVRLTQIGRGEPASPLLEADRLFVRPGLSALIRGRLSPLVLHGALYNGVVEASLDNAGGAARATVHLRALQVGQHPMVTAGLVDGQVTGNLSGSVTVESRRGNLRESLVAGDLNVTELNLNNANYARQVDGLTAYSNYNFQFATVATKFLLQGNKLNIQDFRADGKQYKADGSGQVLLREPLRDSVLNLRVNLQTGSAPDATATNVVEFVRSRKDRPDGPVVVTGTVGHPRSR